MNKKLSEFDEFLDMNINSLVECVQKDVGYDGDIELCSIKDSVTDKSYNISFDDIIRKTISRIRIALNTF